MVNILCTSGMVLWPNGSGDGMTLKKGGGGDENEAKLVLDEAFPGV